MSEITISTGHPDAGRIYAEAFDHVTAERDAALGREAALIDKIASIRAEHDDRVKFRNVRCDALQQRLTAADERADELEGLLRTWRHGRDMTLKDCAILRDKTDTALKPAEAAKCGVCGKGAWSCNEGGCHYLEDGNGEPAEGGGDGL